MHLNGEAKLASSYANHRRAPQELTAAGPAGRLPPNGLRQRSQLRLPGSVYNASCDINMQCSSYELWCLNIVRRYHL